MADSTPALQRPVNGTIDLFEARPIRLDGFILRVRAIEPVGVPSIE